MCESEEALSSSRLRCASRCQHPAPRVLETRCSAWRPVEGALEEESHAAAVVETEMREGVWGNAHATRVCVRAREGGAKVVCLNLQCRRIASTLLGLMATSKTEEGGQDREVGETREAKMAWAAVVEEEKQTNQIRARVASTCGGLS